MTREEMMTIVRTEDLNYSFADGFTRGYNQGFLDGMEMMDRLYNDEKVAKMLRRKDND